jgi:hypothetical protein
MRMSVFLSPAATEALTQAAFRAHRPPKMHLEWLIEQLLLPPAEAPAVGASREAPQPPHEEV